MTNLKNWRDRFDKLFWLHRIPKNTKQMKDIKAFIASEMNSLADNAVTLYMKALDGQKLSEDTWKKIAKVNQIILDKALTAQKKFIKDNLE